RQKKRARLLGRKSRPVEAEEAAAPASRRLSVNRASALTRHRRTPVSLTRSPWLFRRVFGLEILVGPGRYFTGVVRGCAFSAMLMARSFTGAVPLPFFAMWRSPVGR